MPVPSHAFPGHSTAPSCHLSRCLFVEPLVRSSAPAMSIDHTAWVPSLWSINNVLLYPTRIGSLSKGQTCNIKFCLIDSKHSVLIVIITIRYSYAACKLTLSCHGLHTQYMRHAAYTLHETCSCVGSSCNTGSAVAVGSKRHLHAVFGHCL